MPIFLELTFPELRIMNQPAGFSANAARAVRREAEEEWR
jgi:hypothetical protein